MTISINKVFLQGQVGKDIECKFTPGGMQIGTFTVATNKYNSKTEENITSWHSVKVFGKLCENIQAKVLKGATVFIEGEIEYSSWETDGVKKYKTEILGNSVRVEHKKPNTNSGSNSNQNQDQPNNDNQSDDGDGLPF